MMHLNAPQLNDHDLEQLSAYLDRQLAPDEARVLEQRLRDEPELQGFLDDLRRTVSALQELEPVRPPRSFTLDPATLKPKGMFGQIGFVQVIGTMFRQYGAVAGVLMVAFLSVALVSFSNMGSTAMQPAAAPVAQNTALPEMMAVAATPALAATSAPAPLAAESAPMAPQAMDVAPQPSPDVARVPAAPDMAAGTSGSAAEPTALSPNEVAIGPAAAPEQPNERIATPAISSPGTIALEIDTPPQEQESPQPNPLIIGLLGVLLILALVRLFARR